MLVLTIFYKGNTYKSYLILMTNLGGILFSLNKLGVGSPEAKAYHGSTSVKMDLDAGFFLSGPMLFTPP